MENTAPTGIKVPTAEAIEALNQNAQAVAKRSQLGFMTQAQGRIGRDALRRDRQTRTPDAGSFAQPIQEVPEDAAPPRQEIPSNLVKDLVSQFKGTGEVGSDYSGGGVSLSGGSGQGNDQSGSPTTGNSGIVTITQDQGRGHTFPSSQELLRAGWSRDNSQFQDNERYEYTRSSSGGYFIRSKR